MKKAIFFLQKIALIGLLSVKLFGQPDSVFSPLTANLTQICSPGIPGALVFSTSIDSPWRIIVSGDEDTSAPVEFCGARLYGNGRIVAMGHDGIMFEKVFDAEQFHQNVARWLNNGHGGRIGFSIGHNEFVRLNNSKCFKEALANEFSFSELPAPLTLTALEGIDVLVLGNAWGGFNVDERSAIEKFVDNGGGLLLVGLGWSWLQYHPGVPMTAFPMAEIGSHFGVSWAAPKMIDPSDNHNGSPIFHAFYPNVLSSTRFPGRPSAPSFVYSGQSSITSADVLYSEALVEKSEPGTYFCAIQGDSFYFGLQEGGSGYSKHVHFAVWDPAEGDPWTGTGVNKTRFGGEGTGWTIYYPFEWKTNVKYQFSIHLVEETGSTLYLAFFGDPETGIWKHLATIRRTIPVSGLGYSSSFLEDFAEKNAIRRSFLIGNQWARTSDHQWHELQNAMFNCSLGWSNPYTNNFDGDVVSAAFRLETGGLTVRDNTPLDLFTRTSEPRPKLLPAEPVIESVILDESFFQAHFRGAPGVIYTLQISNNLRDWSDIDQIPATQEGYHFGDFLSKTVQFYRFKLWTGL